MFKTERERLEWCVETNTPMLLQKHGEFDSATGFGSIAVIDPEVYDAWHAETGGLGRYQSRAVAEQLRDAQRSGEETSGGCLS